jgi:AcrR family transcriptional regulator
MMPKKSNHYHHGDLRNALMKAALKIISQNGLEALTLRKVSAAVKTSHMAAYRHFKNKKALMAAIAELGFRNLLDSINKRIKKRSDPQDRLKEIGITYFLFAAKHPDFFAVMFDRDLADHKKYPDLGKTANNVVLVLKEVITKCQKTGIFKDRTRDDVAFSFWAHVHGGAELYNRNQFPQKYSQTKMAAYIIQLWMPLND